MNMNYDLNFSSTVICLYDYVYSWMARFRHPNINIDTDPLQIMVFMIGISHLNVHDSEVFGFHM